MKNIAHYLTVLAILVMAGICQAEDKPADAAKPADKARPDPDNRPACSLGLTAEVVFRRLDVDEDNIS